MVLDMTEFGLIVTGMMTTCTTAFTFIMDNAVLALSFCVPVVGGCIGIVKRLRG